VFKNLSTENFNTQAGSFVFEKGTEDMMRASVRTPIRGALNRVFSTLEKQKRESILPDGFTTVHEPVLSRPFDAIAEDSDYVLESENRDTLVLATVGAVFKPTSPQQAAVFPTISQDLSPTMDHAENKAHTAPDGEVSMAYDGVDESYIPLTYQIPEDKMTEALEASPNTTLAWWSYEKYRSPSGEEVQLHYCRSKQTSERTAQLFLGRPVIGCDIEWKASAKAIDGMKQNVSLIQIACEDRVALFHIALCKGETPDEVLAPTLKSILESPDVLKCGVNIGGDCTKMRTHLGIDVVGAFELSHLHKLVEFGAAKPQLVNKKWVSLAKQTEKHLGLPLFKGDERVSDWSQALNMKQCRYAADDAYASYRVFEALKEKWYKLDPRPPFPAFQELKLPIQLAPRPPNEVSESEEDISVIEDSFDEEVDLLNDKLDGLSLTDSGSVASSDESYGDNVFECLIKEQLTQLESPSEPTKIKDYTKASPPRDEEAAIQHVKYPIIPLDSIIADKTSANFVGRLNLQTRFSLSGQRREGKLGHIDHASSSSNAGDTQQNPAQLEDDTPVTAMQDDELLLSSFYKDLSVQAMLWAQQAQVTLKNSSGKPNGVMTLAALRAYYLWEHQKLDLAEIAKTLRDPPLKPATVAAYVAECLQFGDMEWCDIGRLQKLVKELPRQAWGRYWRIRQIANDVD
jgi:hypothetical protein